MSAAGTHLRVLGATGMVGGHALGFALDDPRVSRVTVIGRRSVGVSHPKLREVIHADLLDLSAVSDQLSDVDAVLFCVGVYTGAMSDDAFQRITVDMPISVGSAVLERNPEAVFCLLSGQGADRTGASRMAFARFKGMAENALASAGFKRFHSYRPGYIYPTEPRDEPNFSYRVMRVLYPAVRVVYPNIGIPAPDLARAMVEGAIVGTPHQAETLENADIRAVAVALG
jgi:uncharacterized protein YbjT (DUF2867 family)